MEQQQNAIPLKQVRRYFASNPHRYTVNDWIHKGLMNRRTGKRCYLESFLSGTRRFVTLEAIQKFQKETNERGEDHG